MNEQEYEVLDNEQLPHEAKLLYVMVLRRYMDCQTGIVGFTKRLSFKGMREALEVNRPRRSRVPSQSYNDRQVRYYLELLEKHGFIERLPEPCVYRLVLADSGIGA